VVSSQLPCLGRGTQAARAPVFPGYWLLATGYRLLATGYRLLATGCWLLATGYGLLATGYWLLATSPLVRIETGHFELSGNLPRQVPGANPDLILHVGNRSSKAPS